MEGAMETGQEPSAETRWQDLPSATTLNSAQWTTYSSAKNGKDLGLIDPSLWD